MTDEDDFGSCTSCEQREAAKRIPKPNGVDQDKEFLEVCEECDDFINDLKVMNGFFDRVFEEVKS